MKVFQVHVQFIKVHVSHSKLHCFVSLALPCHTPCREAHQLLSQTAISRYMYTYYIREVNSSLICIDIWPKYVELCMGSYHSPLHTPCQDASVSIESFCHLGVYVHVASNSTRKVPFVCCTTYPSFAAHNVQCTSACSATIRSNVKDCRC